jgi:hypothetical protein
MDCSNGNTHGPAHIKIGGSWTTGKVWTDYSFQYNDIRLLLFKILWRTGITRCDTTCDLEDADGTCKCAIPDSYFEKYNTSYLMTKGMIKTTIGKSNFKKKTKFPFFLTANFTLNVYFSNF